MVNSSAIGKIPAQVTCFMAERPIRACPDESRSFPRLSEYTAAVRASTNPKLLAVKMVHSQEKAAFSWQGQPSNGHLPVRP
jgi:hypothetical protein